MGRYISTTGTASTVLREVNSAYNAVVNDRILADCSGTAFTITLPVSTQLLVNDVIQIIDITGSSTTNNITIARNGAKIQNLSEDLTVNVDNASVTLMYSGVTYGWIIIGS